MDRWEGIERPYTEEHVNRLRGSVRVEHTLARLGAERLWALLNDAPYVNALGAMTGGQAVQMVKAGLKAIYLSGWQVAADANVAGQTYPDQSLYPSKSAPTLVRRLNQALMRGRPDRARRGQRLESNGPAGTGWRRSSPTPRPASAGLCSAFELMRSMIEAGAAGVHFEDQLASEKKCGHLGGKVLVPTSQFIRTLAAARLAADVCDVPTILVARTDALSATLLTSDVDERDRRFLAGERTPEGYFRGRGRHRVRGRTRARLRAVRGPDLVRDVDARPGRGAGVRRRLFARASRASCSRTTARRRSTGGATWTTSRSRRFQEELGALGYRFQFITLAGFHALNAAMFELARGYREQGMSAYVELQEREFELEEVGYTATRHQREVGAGCFDLVAQAVSGGESSTLALKGSTEEAQFHRRRSPSAQTVAPKGRAARYPIACVASPGLGSVR